MGQKNGKASKAVTTPRATPSSDEDEPDHPHLTREKKRSHKDKKMPFFRKQSEEAKKRLHHQLYLAEESPEPLFDISRCEISEVPSKVFPLCHVLQKEVLLLHDNWLSSLASTGTITELKSIRVLDLHNNELKSLPNEMTQLVNLQVLNLENNRLSKLPENLGNLNCLQTLNVKGNRLKVLPQSICNMKSLRLLDISDNRITELPRQLCQVRTLETLTLDPADMSYPPSDVCCSGTEEIMKFLCSECGIEYLPPSKFLINVLDPPKVSLYSQNQTALQQEEKLMQKIEEYSSVLEKKRLERIEMERKFLEHQEEQAQLALLSQKNREELVKIIADEENKFDEELEKLAHNQEKTRQRLVMDLQAVEKGTDDLIATLLDMNAKARKTEELLDEIEQERIKEDKLFEVRWEELQNLRKKEVLDNMKKMLEENENFEMLRQIFTNTKENSLQRALEDDEQMTSAQVNSVLDHHDQQMTVLLTDLARQEQLQKEAFEALQLSKDVKHQRITSQIGLIEDELARLTVVEMEKRAFRTEEEINRLAEKRVSLIALLSQLMYEQDLRQAEIKKRLEEMERQREDGQADYWLVQFQRLMDQKPQSLIDQEQNLEISVVKILSKSNAQDYIPVFARHRISIETMMQLDDNDLKQMGVHELGLRKDILRRVQEYKEDYTSMVTTPAMLWGAGAKSTTTMPTEPTAPSLDQMPSYSKQMSVTARGLNSECSICLDNTSDVIFMNCGHVCCCVQCAGGVSQCPLCRADIVKKVKLTQSSS